VATSLFSSKSVACKKQLDSFSEAITEAADLLVLAGFATGDYPQRVRENFEKLGPYFVVAPGIAIAHAGPGADVLMPGMSLIKLEQPVVSGSTANDPVSLVFCLCTPDANQHIEALGEFSILMSDPAVINSLLKASAESVILEILKI
jgi:ascorbate PTS system EIIA or EIIAB component